MFAWPWRPPCLGETGFRPAWLPEVRTCHFLHYPQRQLAPLLRSQYWYCKSGWIHIITMQALEVYSIKMGLLMHKLDFKRCSNLLICSSRSLPSILYFPLQIIVSVSYCGHLLKAECTFWLSQLKWPLSIWMAFSEKGKKLESKVCIGLQNIRILRYTKHKIKL